MRVSALLAGASMVPWLFASAGAQAADGAAAPASTAPPAWLPGPLPAPLTEIHVLEGALWQWLALLVLVLAASLASYIAGTIIIRLLLVLVRRTATLLDDHLVEDLAGPLRLGLGVFLFFVGMRFLRLAEPLEQAMDVVSKIGGVVAVTWLLIRFCDTLGRALQESYRRKDQAASDTLVPLGRRLTKAFLITVALLALLQNLGFNITGIVAGLGIGGLALALAAQKTVENFIGGVMVVADRPVEVGHFCKVGEHIGTVEDIGIRSTRIRTLDRTVVTIPNAEFSSVRIENYGKRDRIRLHAILGVGYDTSPDQMRYLLVELQRMLYAHPKLTQDPCRVRFITLNAFSLDIEVFAYVETQEWPEFLEVREDIYLRIMDIVAESGTYFAYPSQTLYLGRDGGKDGERTEASEAQVAKWREAGEMPLPKFPREAIQSLDDSLEYPPKGSVRVEPPA